MSDLWGVVASARDVDAVTRAATADAMRAWIAAGGDGVALLTCHRAELYGVGSPPGLGPATHVLSHEQAAVHLLRVAAGLESAIVGEDEVLHQVREAMRRSTAAGHIDRRLHRLFQTAIALGRKARSGRTQSSGNLAQSAVTWLQTKTDLAGRLVVVAGAGRMGATLAHTLSSAGAKVVVSSRDPHRATRLARLYGAGGVSLREGAALIVEASAVAVALAGPWSDLQSVAGASLPPIADISAPQSVPHSVRGRMNGNFLGIDDLYRRPHPLPGAYIEDAERLVAAGAAAYIAWLDRLP